MGLDLGIREGKDAASMARDLKQYLQHPDKLFRRVRDEHGNLHLSKAAADFHPGRGVYRASYMNARRLAATETNIAYRTADHERMKNLDFVVGIEIHLSHNHTCKGRDDKPHPFTDICNELEGKYPKDFKFTGWHPHCRCYVTSILKTHEEIAEDTKKILRGEPVDGESENTVEDVTEGYKKWVEKNEKRIKEAKKKGTLPYFVRDNEKMVSRMKVGNYKSKDNGIRTDEEVKNISEVPPPDKIGRFVEISHDEMMKKLRDLSKDFTHEEAYVVLADGRVYHKIGHRREVNFTEEEKALFKGGKMYHNHGHYPLSPNDIAFMYVYKLKSILAVTTSMQEFTAFAPRKYNSYAYTYIVKELSKKADDMVWAEMQRVDSIKSDEIRRNMQFYRAKELCKILKVKFTY